MTFLTTLLSLFKPKPKLSVLQIACNSVAAKKLVTGSRGLEGKELEEFFWYLYPLESLNKYSNVFHLDREFL